MSACWCEVLRREVVYRYTEVPRAAFSRFLFAVPHERSAPLPLLGDRWKRRAKAAILPNYAALHEPKQLFYRTTLVFIEGVKGEIVRGGSRVKPARLVKTLRCKHSVATPRVGESTLFVTAVL